jgi:hypothetical protein
MREADAVEMAQPLPVNPMSRITPSCTFTYTVKRSPQRGLSPIAVRSASGISRKFRGALL